jgi:hypothetical protein
VCTVSAEAATAQALLGELDARVQRVLHRLIPRQELAA